MGFITAAIATAVIGAGVVAGTQGRPKSPTLEFPDAKDTGRVTEEEVKHVAAKRLFRAGIIATSPTGLGVGETTAAGRLR